MKSQVLVDGCWCRVLHGTVGETACSVLYNTQFCSLRTFSLVGPLCRNCHTIRELGISEEIADEKAAGIGRKRRNRITKVKP